VKDKVPSSYNRGFIVPLAQYYPGDDAWRKFAEAWAQCWPSCPFKEELLVALDGDALLAQAMFGVLGDQAFSWLDSSVPALNAHTPRSLLTNKSGILSVRTCLMRMP
jgi:hypothetical protein